MIPLPMIGSFIASNWRILILGSLLLLLGIQTWRLDRCQDEYSNFKVTIEALGRAQKAKIEADKEANEQLTKEVVDAKDKAIADLSTRYARARAAARRVPVSAGSGGVPSTPEAPPLASACESPDRLASRLGELEAALLGALERADGEMVKYRQLWDWAMRVR